ncbi:MAG: SpoIIE family protein phosphatase [Clostridiales bacterium]|nr:SpoIIE family protein phosphatase [Clostridiales bacterium]
MSRGIRPKKKLLGFPPIYSRRPDVSEQRQIRLQLAQEIERMRREAGIAHRLQLAVLPSDDIYWDTLSVGSVMIPAEELIGDFFDVLRIGRACFLFYVADVSGHGIQTSLLTIYLQERMRAHAAHFTPWPSSVLQKLAHDFCELQLDSSLYVTMALCLYDSEEQTLTISNAGHNCPPLIVRGDGQTETIPIRGLPISILSDEADYEDQIIPISKNDRIILYTDGVVDEADKASGQAFGHEDVCREAKRTRREGAAEAVQHIIGEARKYDTLMAKDDQMIMAVDILR